MIMWFLCLEKGISTFTTVGRMDSWLSSLCSSIMASLFVPRKFYHILYLFVCLFERWPLPLTGVIWWWDTWHHLPPSSVWNPFFKTPQDKTNKKRLNYYCCYWHHVGRRDSFKMRSYSILYHLYLHKAGNIAVDRIVYTLVLESRT